ncbi:uncharacterized protein BT62DRAFT_1010228 [Guyanagaster necrorhizus]|uniref:Uncharacterized protein n=1 Tax=Guyanagaster necrorhizus TaxID=856835 RepID=A0A9P7VK66_9AGAR|nr:uncharacterized protein BT62DRAFT_1010228 [Guyanagaster necrorhizus MCA 3950]KAG7442618.1 hypothetical protein BT62DRAFT_1010228 [Guyanagaster necrorhizus MCA 3950]
MSKMGPARAQASDSDSDLNAFLLFLLLSSPPPSSEFWSTGNSVFGGWVGDRSGTLKIGLIFLLGHLSGFSRVREVSLSLSLLSSSYFELYSNVLPLWKQGLNDTRCSQWFFFGPSGPLTRLHSGAFSDPGTTGFWNGMLRSRHPIELLQSRLTDIHQGLRCEDPGSSDRAKRSAQHMLWAG